MLEVSGISLSAEALDGSDEQQERLLRRKLGRLLHVRPSELAVIELRRRSIDARKKSDVRLLYTVRVGLAAGEDGEQALLARLQESRAVRQIRLAPPSDDTGPWVEAHASRPSPVMQPVVIGAGCAGLFCALALAEAGRAPLLVERGDGTRERTAAVARFNETGVLDPESNIQFGLGGAGTFSDGKLATGTKSPLHRRILQEFVHAGAASSILWDAKPHVGSDVLPTVVRNICARIEELGGEVRLRTRMTDIDIADGAVCGVTLVHLDETGAVCEERLHTSQLVLASGHSARDVFALLRDKGVPLERKTFAMGYRIEHLQADIDRAQYGRFAGLPSLGAAPYKLSTHTKDGRGVFSFCMCPGGYVVAAASEPGGVATNGMSLSGRAGTNANAGLLANVFPEDLPGEDVLAGLALQRQCEQAAYAAGGGSYVAPAQLVGDFLRGVPSSAAGRVLPTYPRGVAWGDLSPCLPDYVTESIRTSIPLLARRLRGFDAADAVLTGVETRSSSPVRVTRGTDGQSVGVRGLFPCGEGAGYAGGIMSAATDGIRCAQWVCAH